MPSQRALCCAAAAAAAVAAAAAPAPPAADAVPALVPITAALRERNCSYVCAATVGTPCAPAPVSPATAAAAWAAVGAECHDVYTPSNAFYYGANFSSCPYVAAGVTPPFACSDLQAWVETYTYYCPCAVKATATATPTASPTPSPAPPADAVPALVPITAALRERNCSYVCAATVGTPCAPAPVSPATAAAAWAAVGVDCSAATTPSNMWYYGAGPGAAACPYVAAGVAPPFTCTGVAAPSDRYVEYCPCVASNGTATATASPTRTATATPSPRPLPLALVPVRATASCDAVCAASGRPCAPAPVSPDVAGAAWAAAGAACRALAPSNMWYYGAGAAACPYAAAGVAPPFACAQVWPPSAGNGALYYCPCAA
jgi:hypothetical protein